MFGWRIGEWKKKCQQINLITVILGRIRSRVPDLVHMLYIPFPNHLHGLNPAFLTSNLEERKRITEINYIKFRNRKKPLAAKFEMKKTTKRIIIIAASLCAPVCLHAGHVHILQGCREWLENK